MKAKNITETSLLLLMLISTSLIAITPGKATFDLSQVAYYDRIKRVLSLTRQDETTLSNNGFVIVDISNRSLDSFLDPKMRFEDFYYSVVYANDLPVIVTTDSILHLFHVVFDCSLKNLEKSTFYPMLLEVTQSAFNSSLNDYKSIRRDNPLKYWAIRNSTVYFAIALSLLTGETVELPAELSEDVTFYLNNILASDPRFVIAGKWHMPELFCDEIVQYDFTQFKVRGHYFGDQRLERYFRTFMWYGQYPIFIPRNDEHYVWCVPHFDEATIVHIRDVLKSSPECYEKWMLLYNVTSALVGGSDSINLMNLEIALKNVFGHADRYLDCVAMEDGLTSLKEELAKPEYEQHILSQALVSELPGVWLPHYPIVFQFMGQRYVPDSYIFQMLCFDKVGLNPNHERRIMPKGLDVFAVLGSERAYQKLNPDLDFENYTRNLETLRQDFENLTEEDWTQSSYTAWVYALKSLIEKQKDDNNPEFMRAVAWQDEKLNTASGSWAQLRHDTILYAKQTYIPGWMCSYPEAFVEPYPIFYSRMQKLSQRTIEAVSMLKTESLEPTIIDSLQTLETVTEKLALISTKELAKESLTSDEVEFIKHVAWQCGSGGFIGWYVDTIHAVAMATNSTSSLETPVIADVATFPPGDFEYPPQILHVGVGYVNALVILFPMPNGTLVAAVGPVFSYYEFRLIGTKRLNDDEWKKILTFDNRTAYLPAWFKDIYGTGEPLPITPEYPNAAVFFVVMIVTPTIMILAQVAKTKKRKIAIRDINILGN